LYPNSDSRTAYNYIEKFLSKKIHNISDVWFCTGKHCEILFKNGIKSYLDNRCNAELLGFKGNKARTIDAILNIQRSNKVFEICGDIQLPNNPYYFIDIETIPKILLDNIKSPNQSCNDIIYLIGYGFIQNNEFKWNYFISNKLIKSESKRIVKQLMNIIPDNATLFHWGHFDMTTINKYTDRQLNWVNLYNIFVNTPIVIKGCVNYKLKNIVNALYNHKLISLKYSEIDSGIDSSIYAVDYFKDFNTTQLSILLKYNKIDCEVLYNLVKLIEKK
jgi:hypothetical protein